MFDTFNIYVYIFGYKYNAKSAVDNRNKCQTHPRQTYVLTHIDTIHAETFSISIGEYWYPNKWIIRVFTTTRTADTSPILQRSRILPWKRQDLEFSRPPRWSGLLRTLRIEIFKTVWASNLVRIYWQIYDKVLQCSLDYTTIEKRAAYAIFKYCVCNAFRENLCQYWDYTKYNRIKIAIIMLGSVSSIMFIFKISKCIKIRNPIFPDNSPNLNDERSCY